jgi:hypothetical protein
MVPEDLSEVRLTQPAVNVPAHFQAHRFRSRGRTTEAFREIRLTEATLPKKTIDLIAQARFRALHQLAEGEKLQIAVATTARARARRGLPDSL